MASLWTAAATASDADSWLSGVVVDAQGHPVAGAQLILGRADGHRKNRGRCSYEDVAASSEPSGFFWLSVPASTACRLWIIAEGYADADVALHALPSGAKRSFMRIALDRGQTLTGRLVDDSQRPVAGASIRVIPRAAEISILYPGLSHPDHSIRETVTNTAGRFEIPHLSPVSYDVEITAEGSRTTKVPRVPLGTGGAKLDLGDLILLAGATIAGTVVDADGKPIPDHRVQAGEISLRTGGDGVFRFDGFEPGKPVHLYVTRTDRLLHVVRQVLPPVAGLRIALVRGGVVVGQVVDEAGKLVEGARATAYDLNRNAAATPVETDAAGRFQLAPLGQGTVVVTVEADGFRTMVTDPIGVGPGADHDLRIVLERGATLEGRVVDADGMPVHRASLTAEPKQGQMASWPSTSTKGDGRYRLTGLETGPTRLRIRHNGGTQHASLTVPSGTTQFDVVLESGTTVSGRAIDHRGQPVASARIYLNDRGSGSNRLTTTSAADGSFHFAAVPAGRYHLQGQHRAFAHAFGHHAVTVTKTPVSSLRLEFEKGATISGAILGLSPQALAEVEIRAQLERGNRMAESDLGIFAVDRDGRFRLDHRVPGAWAVSAHHRDRSRVLRVVARDAVATPIHFEFTGRETLAGTLTIDGRAAADVQIFAAGIDTPVAARTTSRADGRFTFDGLEPGRYLIRTDAGDDVPTAHRFVDVPKDHDATWDIATARLTVRVVDEHGRPIDAASLSLAPWPPALEGSRSQSASEGQAVFAGIASGHYRLVARAPDLAVTAEVIEVRADRGNSTIDLTLDPAEPIEVEAIRSVDGTPPRQLWIRSLDGDAGPVGLRRLHPTTEGRWRIEGLARGPQTLLISGARTETVVLEVEVPGPSVAVNLLPSVHVDVGLSTPPMGFGSLGTLTVFDEAGRVLARRAMTTNASLSNLPPGDFRFEARMLDGRVYDGTISAVADALNRVVLEQSKEAASPQKSPGAQVPQ